MRPAIHVKVDLTYVAPIYHYYELCRYGSDHKHTETFLGWDALLKHVDLPLFVRAPTREGVYWLNPDDLPPTTFAPIESLKSTNFWKQAEKPYPFCHGNPQIIDCILAGYCRRVISCCD